MRRGALPLGRLAACGLLGPVQFTLAWAALGFLRPDYSHRRQFISELAAAGAPYAGVMTGAFLLLGLLSLAFARGLHRGISRGRGSPLGPALIALFGAGSIGSGIFRCDPGCGGHSWANALHTLITHLGLGALVLATVTIPLRFTRDPAWRAYRAYSWLTGLVAVGLFAKGFAAFGGAGLGQRLFIGVLFLWLGVLALRLLQLVKRAPA